MQFTFLGTGTSHGVPVIACECDVCRSNDPRDKRLRSSALVSFDDATILVDTTPEFRIQALAQHMTNLDAVLMTHTHADHLHGIDDLRAFTERTKMPIPVYADAPSSRDIQDRFAYIFKRSGAGAGVAILDLRTIDGPFYIKEHKVIPIPILHGHMPVTGFRFDNLAYLTDCSSIPEESFPLLQGLDVLVIDALRFREHPTHFNVAQALDIVTRVQPRIGYLTHLTHDILHARDIEKLPPTVTLAYDGLTLDLPDLHNEEESL